VTETSKITQKTELKIQPSVFYIRISSPSDMEVDSKENSKKSIYFLTFKRRWQPCDESILLRIRYQNR
jgi:hypothetical protein